MDNLEENLNRFIAALNDESKFKNYKEKNFEYKSLETILGNDKSKIKNKNLEKLLNRLTSFYKELTNNVDLNNKLIEKEYLFINDMGWHCVYMSLILKELAKKNFNINLKLYQGIFFYEHSPNVSWIFGDIGMGFHSWCMYKDSILDTTFLHQQNSFLINQSSLEYLNGSVIKGVTYKGEIVSDDIIDKYIKDILSVNNLSYEDWLLNIENYILKYK